ncbi:hypothetical protein RJ639_028514 [Escallonia herrerae]|uniref:Uncharacterized protein n=1 Tax=Escallonia herrerae TaxID=1293975 RepID=A0AA88X367_9ASTE|nr:hypothetical protein RJ639_028514 [Escallonia herrerae]
MGSVKDGLDIVEQNLQKLEDHVLEELDTLKKVVKSQDELRTRFMELFLNLQEQLDVIEVSVKETRQDTAMCKRTIVGGVIVTPSLRVDTPKLKEFAGQRDTEELDNFIWHMEHYSEGASFTDQMTKWWKMQVEDYLYQKDLYLPLVGEKPEAMNANEWVILDKKVLATVRLSLTPQVAINISKEKSTAVVMQALEKLYEKPYASNKDLMLPFSYLDIILLTHFIRGSPLNIAGIIMLVMNARKTKSSANLPFGLLLTCVFEHFHVPLPTSTLECIPLPSHHVLDETSLRRAGFVLRSDLTSDTVLLERVTATDPSHTQSVSASTPSSLPPPSPAPEIPSAAFSAPPSSFPPTPPSSTPFIPPAQTDPSSSFPFPPPDPSSSIPHLPTPPHPFFSSPHDDFSNLNFDEFLSSDTPNLSETLSRLSTSIHLILESQTTLAAIVAANHTALLHELTALQQSVQHSSAQLLSNQIDFHNLLNDLTANLSSLPLNHTPLMECLSQMQQDLRHQQETALGDHRRQAYLITSILTEQNRYLAHQIFDQAHGFWVTRPDIFPSRHTNTEREEWFFNPHIPYNPPQPRFPRVVEVVEVPTTAPPPADPSSSTQGARRSRP